MPSPALPAAEVLPFLQLGQRGRHGALHGHIRPAGAAAAKATVTAATVVATAAATTACMSSRAEHWPWQSSSRKIAL